jgi:anti-sigma B factor antagonist
VELEFEVRSRREREATVLVLRGELDLASHRALEQDIARALASPPVAVVLDLGALAFVDLAGLRSMLRSARRASGAGKRLLLANPPQALTRLVVLTRQESSVTVFGSVAEALEDVADPD